MNTIMRQNDVCYVRKCNPVVLSPVSLACVCRASSGVTHRYTQPAYTTGALRLSGLHTVTHWSEWLQTLDPQYWTKIRILPTVSVYFALNFTFRLVPHALPQCTAGLGSKSYWISGKTDDHYRIRAGGIVQEYLLRLATLLYLPRQTDSCLSYELMLFLRIV